MGSSGGQLFSGSANEAAQISILSRAPGFTTSELDPVCPPSVATTLVWPGPLAAAKPIGLTVATVPSVALQPAVRDRSCCVPSLKLPVARNCCPPPNATFALPGTTLIPLSVPTPTLRTADELPTLPCASEKLAETFAVPVPTPVASSCNPLANATEATAVLSLDQDATPLMSCWKVPALSAKVASAIIFCAPTGAMVA